MNLGAIMDHVAGIVDEHVLAVMQEYGMPPSLMDKVLDKVQSHMRQMKSEEYADELARLQLSQPKQATENNQDGPVETEHTGTVEEFKEEFKDIIENNEEEKQDADV